MKSILLHLKDFEVRITKKKINPSLAHQRCQDCVAVLVTIEEDDSDNSARSLVEEITKMCQDTGRDKIVVLPFAHLSSSLMKNQGHAMDLINLITEELKAKNFNVIKSDFGTDKGLLLDIHEHQGNVRFREF